MKVFGTENKVSIYGIFYYKNIIDQITNLEVGPYLKIVLYYVFYIAA